MSDKIAEVSLAMKPDSHATWVVNLWTSFSTQRDQKLNDWAELEKYIFQTDTSTTSNATLDWENTTSTPKLCNIRDNLFANYKSALFPNDKWLKWEGYTKDASKKEVAKTITSYMSNKAREGGLRSEVDKMLLNYIDYGNAFAMPSFERRHADQANQGYVPEYIGPKAVSIHPADIVFNPLADHIHNTFKIIRSVKTLGELKKLSVVEPGNEFWAEAVTRRFEKRKLMSGISRDDFNKAEQYTVDGFGNLFEYYQSEYVEILEFYGDFHNVHTGTLETNRMITIIDRDKVVRDVAIPTYSGRAPIEHVGWRRRPNNLWAMGPLDNLIGMQYRLDHLENAKADAFDLALHTPLLIQGEVEPFSWGPKTQIHMDAGDGGVSEVAKNLNAIITADSQMEKIEARMEMFAGAPREAAGFRTPGEKTALEFDSLQTAGSRMFQEKITNFEVELFEPLLNGMLEIAHRNMDGVDIIAVLDDDLGVKQFREVSKSDITAAGILRPIGARHFAEKAKELQNMVGIFSSPLGDMIRPHTSSIEMANYIEDSLDIRGYDMFRPNVAVAEQKDTQSLMNQAGEDAELEAQVATEEEEVI